MQVLIDIPQTSKAADRPRSPELAVPQAGGEETGLIVAGMTGGAIIAFVLIAPNLGIWYHWLNAYDLQRELQIALLVLAALLWAMTPGRAMPPPSGGRSGIPTPARWAFAGIAALGLLSSLGATRPQYALRELTHTVLLWFLAMRVAAAVRSVGESVSRRFAHAIAISCLLYAVAVIASLVQGNIHPETVRELFIGFANPRYFGDYLTWTLPLVTLPLVAWPPARWLPRMGFWSAAIGWWTLFLMSGSRGSAIGLFIGFACALLIFRHRAVRWLQIHVASAVVGIMAYMLLIRTSGGTVERLVRDGVHDPARLALWAYAGRLIQGSPWLGIGPGQFAHHRSINLLYGAHPHNALVQLAAEWGLPAGLLVAGLGIWALCSWIRANRAAPSRGMGDSGLDSVRVALTASFLAAGAAAMVSGVIVMPLSQTIGALIAGWALGVHQSSETATGGVDQHRPAWFTRAAILATITVLIATARLPHTSRIAEPVITPRFWLYGGIP